MRHRRMLWAVFLFLLILSVPVLAQDHGMGWLPENASTLGHEIDLLYRIILWVVTGMFILVEGLLLIFVFKYRRRPGHKAHYTHGSNKAELIWTIVPGLMLFALAIGQANTWKKAKSQPPDPKTSFRVQVIARRFNWNFRYPGDDRKFGTDDDICAAFLVAPVGKPVYLEIRSVDVIHSLFIPNMRFKQDAVPGMKIVQWFTPEKTTDQIHGEYIDLGPDNKFGTPDDTTSPTLSVPSQGRSIHVAPIACAELCGALHGTMKSYLYVASEAEVNAWLKKQYDYAPSDKDAAMWSWWKD